MRCCEGVVRMLSGCCQGVVRVLSGCSEGVVRCREMLCDVVRCFDML